MATPSHTYDALVRAIYAGAGEAQPWQTFMRSYREHLRGSDLGIEIHLPQLGGFPILLRDCADPRVLPLYQDYAQEDPWRGYPMPPGEVATFDQVIDMDHLRQTRFYRDFMCRHGALYGMKATWGTRDSSASLLMGRTARQGNFSARNVRECRRLLPHLQEALGQYQTLALAQLRADTAQALQAGQSLLVLWLDGAGRVLPWHDEALLRELAPSLELRDGRIRLCEADTQRALQTLIQQALRSSPTEGEKTLGAIGLGWNDRDGRSLLVKTCGGHGHLHAQARVAVYVCAGAGAPRASAALIAQVFELSATQARLALLLVRGHSLRSAAQVMDISEHTARTHAKQIFAKTGSSGQTDLVRRILGSVAALECDCGH